MSYNILEDESYLEEVSLVFNNGILKLYTDGTWDFQEGVKDPTLRNLFSFYMIDFEEELLDNEPGKSIIYEWLRYRIPDPDAFDLVQQFFGSILVPSYQGEIFLSLYSSEGGTGKSLLTKTLDKMLGYVTSNVKLDEINNSYVGTEFEFNILNISNETDGKIPFNKVKALMDGTKQQVREIYESPREMIPIAKHIVLSNQRPNYVSDGGMVRRAVVFELTNLTVRPEIEASQFERLFKADYRSLVRFMIGGIRRLQQNNWHKLSIYWRDHDRFAKYRLIQEASTSSIKKYLMNKGYEYLLISGTVGVTKKKFYDSYVSWATENLIPTPVVDKHFFTAMKADKFINTNARVESKRVLKINDIYRDLLVKTLEEAQDEDLEQC